MITRPMLAVQVEDLASLQYPVLASPKLDGIRAIKVGGRALSRKFLPIPNHHVRNWMENNLPDGIDGELMIFDAQFNDVQSGIMSREGTPNFYFAAFDYVTTSLEEPFSERYEKLKLLKSDPKVIVVEQKLLNSPEEVLSYEKECLEKGYEGLMIRKPSARYKCGRSTLKEGILLKLKQFNDSEAVIIGFEELMTNQNELEVNELGLAKRSTKKEGMVGVGSLGKFVVKDLKTGVEFECGTGDGLTKELRQTIWSNKDQYLGKLIKYKYFPGGVKEKPRFPVWIGFRSEDDL